MPMGVYRFMGIYACQWVSVGLWVFMGFMVSMGIYGCIWIFIGVYAHIAP